MTQCNMVQTTGKPGTDSEQVRAMQALQGQLSQVIQLYESFEIIFFEMLFESWNQRMNDCRK